METKRCASCGSEFHRRPGEPPSRWRARECCSPACGARLPRKGRIEPVPNVKACAQCGAAFERPASYREKQWRERAYCSNVCAGKGRAKAAHALRPRRVCPICQEEFGARHPERFQTTCGKPECKGAYRRQVASVKLAERMREDYASGRRKPARGVSQREEALAAGLIEHGWKWRLRWYDGDGRIEMDFAHPERKINVEIDGPEHRYSARAREDARRDDLFRERGWTVVRIPNEDVDADPAGVLARILNL